MFTKARESALTCGHPRARLKVGKGVVHKQNGPPRSTDGNSLGDGAFPGPTLRPYLDSSVHTAETPLLDSEESLKIYKKMLH